MTSPATRNAISSRAPGSGPLQLDLLDGLTPALSGPHPAPASRSRRPAKVSASMIQGICGQTWIDSSVAPASEASDPLSLWESRLRDRLATIGSTECALIWRSKDTGLGWSISRLAPWTPPTSASGSTGAPWPTAQARDGFPPHSPEYVAKHKANGHGMANLNDYLAFTASHWPTPDAAAMNHGCDPVNHQERLDRMKAKHGNGNGAGMTIGFMLAASHWATPRASDGEKGGPNMSFGAGGQPLPAQMHQATWRSPNVVEAKGGTRNGPGQVQLKHQLARTAPLGPEQTGSSATTAKRGAPNPDFAFWLMGWPAEFRRGVLAAIASIPSSRRKSSRP